MGKERKKEIKEKVLFNCFPKICLNGNLLKTDMTHSRTTKNIRQKTIFFNLKHYMIFFWVDYNTFKLVFQLLEDVLKINRVVMQLYEDNIVFVSTFGRESVNQSVLKICGRKTGETLKRKFLRNKLKSTEATKISSQCRGRKRAIFKHLWIFSGKEWQVKKFFDKPRLNGFEMTFHKRENQYFM